VIKSGGVLDFTALTGTQPETLSFRENAAGTRGVLAVTDGTLRASLVLFGNYVAAGFHLSRTAGEGTLITYEPPAGAHLNLAAGHKG
jgi:hypothetical protein